MTTDERRARALCSYATLDTTKDYVDANWPRFLPQSRAIRESDEAALGLRPDQLQLDENSPGLYIQCATTEQRREIMAMIAVKETK